MQEEENGKYAWIKALSQDEGKKIKAHKILFCNKMMDVNSATNVRFWSFPRFMTILGKMSLCTLLEISTK